LLPLSIADKQWRGGRGVRYNTRREVGREGQ
jgi:hypothetical protein